MADKKRLTYDELRTVKQGLFAFAAFGTVSGLAFGAAGGFLILGLFGEGMNSQILGLYGFICASAGLLASGVVYYGFARPRAEAMDETFEMPENSEL